MSELEITATVEAGMPATLREVDIYLNGKWIRTVPNLSQEVADTLVARIEGREVELHKARVSNLQDQLAQAAALAANTLGDSMDRAKEITALKAENERLKEALQTFGEHQRECDWFYWERGEPTADGGYRTMWKGKWYVRPDEPPCTCGLDAALSPTEEKG